MRGQPPTQDISSPGATEGLSGQSCPLGLVPWAASLGRPSYAVADVGENLPGPCVQAVNKLCVGKERRDPKESKLLKAEITETVELQHKKGACQTILVMNCWWDSGRGMILAMPSALKSQESEVGRQLEEREPWRKFWRKKNLIFICLTRVLCRGKGRVSPLTNEEYICLTYLKSSSWSMGKGQFKCGTEIFKVTA